MRATKAERELLETAAKVSEGEVANLIGKPVRIAEGEIKLSKLGHLFSCSSPCSMLREKYAAVLAKDAKLEGELVQLEKRALEAAAETKRGGPKAAELAEAVKKDAAALEKTLARDAAYIDAMKKIGGLDPAISAKIAQLDKDAIVRIGTLDAEAIQKLSKLELNALKKLTGLPEETFKNLAHFGEASLKKALEQAPLAAGKNFKEHFIDKRALLEKALGIRVGKLKEGGGYVFLKTLTDGIKDGTFRYAGQGTLKKGQAVMNIFRGKGLTVVTQSTGEWVTLLKSGEGLDLAIQMVP